VTSYTPSLPLLSIEALDIAQVCWKVAGRSDLVGRQPVEHKSIVGVGLCATEFRGSAWMCVRRKLLRYFSGVPIVVRVSLVSPLPAGAMAAAAII